MTQGRRWAARAFLLLFASLFIVALLVRSVGVDRLVSTLRAADARLLGLAAACYAAEIGLRMARWRLLFRATTLGPAMNIWFIGTGVNELLPSGAGEIARGVVGAERYRVPAATVIAPTVVERLMDLIILLGFAGLALSLLIIPIPVVSILVPLLAVLFGIALLTRPRLLAPPARWLQRRGPASQRMGGFLARLEEQLSLMARRRGTLGAAFAATVSVWALEGLVQWVALRALGGQVSAAAVLGFTALAFLFGFVSFLPGGLGSREAALAALFTLYGVVGHVATTAAVGVRAVQTLAVLLLGAGATVIAFGWRRSDRRRGAARQEALGAQTTSVPAEVPPVLPED